MVSTGLPLVVGRDAICCVSETRACPPAHDGGAPKVALSLAVARGEEGATIRSVLVSLDGSALSEAVLPVVKQLLEGGVEEATLFIVGEAPQATVQRRAGLRRPLPLASGVGSYPTGVIPAAPPKYGETKDQAVERREHELLEYLDQVGRPLLETGRSIHAAVRLGEAAEEIIDFAKREGIELIAMATHGRSGLREALQGSVTEEVIRSGVAPVLVVRPKAADE